METAYLNSDTESTYQVFEDIIDVNGENRRVRYELRYLEKAGKWFLSMFDVETGESYFRYVPMVSTKTNNNLISPFAYKGMRIVVCLANVDEPSSVNPEKENFGQFWVMWSDGYAE